MIDQCCRAILAAALALCVMACQPTTEDKLGTFSGNPERGRLLADQYGCGTCHRIPQVPGARGQVGPPLEQMGRRGYIAGILPNTEQAMIAWLLSPRTFAADTAMPDVGLAEEQARDIAAFLQRLR
ncbi:MAG TPA: c-type cytochrome [Pseudomonas sp.]|uniref:c-type cytochrome n=1 Tax=Pseudomonas sp. TaxID=306 RepID=UPI0026388757|nr:c-type cytochrome [Pseudomonas sp.]HSX91004.1 c-type cytochrome [Pseudomonas sp.]